VATKVGTGYVDIIGNFAPLMKQAKSSTLKSRLATVGKVGALAVAGIGVAAVNASMDFNKSMRLISTSAGASAGEIKDLRDQVLELSTHRTFAPKELADALFHIESVGYRGAKAMKVLSASSKLAEVGQADLEDTTNAVVGAMQSGIKGTEKMGETIGMLNAIVGQGNMRMDEMTGALSTGVLPAAKAFGLSLQDVGSALDVMTSKGMSAQQSATRLRMTFSLMAAPSDEAAKALGQIGLSADKLGEVMRTKGLPAAIQLLSDKLDQAGLSGAKAGPLISEAFGGGRSSAAILTLIQNVDDLHKKFNGIGQATEDFGKKWKQVQDKPGVKLQEAANELQVVLIKLGDVITPAFASAVKDVTDVLTGPGSFSDKLSTLADMAAHVVSSMGPKLAAAAVAGGFAIVKGIITGFIHADLAGKLAIIAAGITIAGQWGVLGAAIGRTLAATIAKTLGVAIVAESGTVGLAAAGRAWAFSLSGALAKALPAAIAVAGIANIVSSGIKGDTKQTLFKTGGALAGGLVGGLVGGLPGALVGSGIGSFLGGWLGGLFDSQAAKHIGALQKVHKASRDITKGFRSAKDAVDSYHKSANAVSKSHEQVKRTADNVKRAEQHYQNVLERHRRESMPAIRAEKQLHDAVEAHRKALKREENAEKLAGQQRKFATHQIAFEYQHIKQVNEGLKDQVRHLKKHFIAAEQSGASDKKLSDINNKLKEAQQAQSKAAAKQSGLLLKAAQEVGPKFAKSLKDGKTAVQNLGVSQHNLTKDFQVYYQKVGPVIQETNRWNQSLKEQKRNTDPLGNVFKKNLINPFDTMSHRTIPRASHSITDFTHTTHGMSKKSGDDMRDTGRDAHNLQTSIDKFQRVSSQNIGSFSGAVGDGMGTVSKNFNQIAKGLGGGVSPIKFHAVTMKGQHKAAGGEIVPGHGVGDVFHTAVPVGSFILNKKASAIWPMLAGGGPLDKKTGRRHPLTPVSLEPGERLFDPDAVSQIGLRTLRAVNNQFPRFATGGTAGMKPAAAALATYFVKTFGGGISSGLRAGDTGSFHSLGEAFDWVPGNANAGTDYANKIGPSILEGIHNPAGWGNMVSWDSGNRVSPSFWGSATWADHIDHLHVATNQGIGAKASMGVQSIPDMVFKGPDGGLHDIGQGVLDKAVNEVNDFLAKHSGGLGLDVPTGPIQQMAKQMLDQMGWANQWPQFNALEMSEAGWDPTAQNSSSGAAGLAQALPPSKYPPGAWPYHGLESAKLQLQWMMQYIKQRYGSPAAAWSFHQANNWYREGGLVRQLLAGGGDVGGSAGGFGGTDIPPGYPGGGGGGSGGGFHGKIRTMHEYIQKLLGTKTGQFNKQDDITKAFQKTIKDLDLPKGLLDKMHERAISVATDRENESRLESLDEILSFQYDQLAPALDAAMEATDIAAQLGLAKTGQEQLDMLKGTLYNLLPNDARRALDMLDPHGYLIPSMIGGKNEKGWIWQEIMDLVDLSNSAVTLGGSQKDVMAKLKAWETLGDHKVSDFVKEVRDTLRKKEHMHHQIDRALDHDKHHIKRDTDWLGDHPLTLMNHVTPDDVYKRFKDLGFKVSGNEITPGDEKDMKWHKIREPYTHTFINKVFNKYKDAAKSPNEGDWWRRLKELADSEIDKEHQDLLNKLFKAKPTSDEYKHHKKNDVIKLREHEAQFRRYLAYMTGDKSFRVGRPEPWDDFSTFADATSRSIMGMLRDKKEAIGGATIPTGIGLDFGGESFLDAVNEIRGFGAPPGVWKKLPPLGTYGGSLLDAYTSWATWLPDQPFDTSQTFDGGAADGGDDGGLADLLREQIAILQRQLIVSRAEQPVLASYAGLFAKGGAIPAGMFGIAGEAGPEVIEGPANVYPMGGGGAVELHLNGNIYTEYDLDKAIQVKVNGQLMRTRSHGRRSFALRGS